MPQQKSKKILIYFFLFLLIGTFNNKNLNSIRISKINKISIQGLDKKNIFDLTKNLNFLKTNNLFDLEKAEIIKVINSNSLVENFFVNKMYPSSLIIKIDKTKFLALIKKGGKNFLLGSNGKLTKTEKQNEELPHIFGDFKVESFFELKKAIDETSFSFSEIKNLFFFKMGRWDIETKDGLLIKLPKNEIKKSLKLVINLLSDNNKKNIRKIDLRQNNQIIING